MRLSYLVSTYSFQSHNLLTFVLIQNLKLIDLPSHFVSIFGFREPCINLYLLQVFIVDDAIDSCPYKGLIYRILSL